MMELHTKLIQTKYGTLTASRMVNKIDKWTPSQVTHLCIMVESGRSFAAIAQELKRKESACRSMYSYAKLRRQIRQLEHDNEVLKQKEFDDKTEYYRVSGENLELSFQVRELEKDIEGYRKAIEIRDNIITELRGDA